MREFSPATWAVSINETSFARMLRTNRKEKEGVAIAAYKIRGESTAEETAWPWKSRIAYRPSANSPRWINALKPISNAANQPTGSIINKILDALSSPLYLTLSGLTYISTVAVSHAAISFISRKKSRS